MSYYLARRAELLGSRKRKIPHTAHANALYRKRVKMAARAGKQRPSLKTKFAALRLFNALQALPAYGGSASTIRPAEDKSYRTSPRENVGNF